MKLKDRMLGLGNELKGSGYEVNYPSLNEVIDYTGMTQEQKKIQKGEMIRRHLERIKDSDAILVVNEKLKDIDSYIGMNSFLEMGFAFALGKKIYLLNEIPKQSNDEEILGLNPTSLKGNLGLI
jgi:nucleoside 2-deoxyribosyltransferase